MHRVGQSRPKTGSDQSARASRVEPAIGEIDALDARADGRERRLHLAGVPIALIADDKNRRASERPAARQANEASSNS